MTSMYFYGTTLGLLFAVVCSTHRPCLSAITSKACYGSDGLPCTKHTLECSSGMIAIQDAYYTNSTACPNVGLSSCGNIRVSSIPDTGRYRDLNETQLNTLCKDCSIKPRCTFNGGRAPNLIYFSVVKYMCISDPDSSSQTCSESRTTDSTDHAGAVAGGVVAAFVVIGVVVAFVLWFKFKRNKERGVKSDKPNDNYSVVTPGSTNAYSSEMTTKSRSNYDYATVQEDITSTGHVKIDNYDLAIIPVEKRITQNSEASRIDEDDCNHLDGQNKTISNGGKLTGYDTSVSALDAVRKLQNSEVNCDYHHLGNNSVKPSRSDYDTAASASRAVAQMVKDKDTAEDDYDHFYRKEIKSSDSPDDTAE